MNPVVFCSVNLTSTTPTAVASYDGTVTFVGTYSPALLPRNVKTNLYMGAGNTLYYPNVDNFYVNACRSYFQLNPSVAAEVRAFVFDFEEDDADALSEYSEYSDYSDNKKGIYDLSGSCIANGQKPTVKGLYIVNGKKIMVR